MNTTFTSVVKSVAGQNATVSQLFSNLLLLLLLAASPLVQAQTGPGGVGNQDGVNGQPENILWLDASILSLTDGAPATAWPDQSGNGLDFGPLGAKATPVFQSNGLNSNSVPVVRFDGTERYLKLADNDKLDDNLAGLTIVVVARHATLDNNARGLLSKRVDQTSQESYSLFTNTNNPRIFFDIRNSNDNRLTGPTTLNTSTDYVHTLIFDDTRQYGYIQGAGDGTRNVSGSGPINNGTADLILGSLNEGYGRYFDGDIAEILLFSSAINEAQRIIIENYLSAKYGLTLSAGDFYAGDTPANNYNFQVIGIGQSNSTIHTAASGGGLVIETLDTSLDTDGEFVIAGHKTANNAVVTSDITGSVQERWERTWYVDKTTTNTLGATIGFDFGDGINGEFPQEATGYVLLRHDGTNFVEVSIPDGNKYVSGDRVFFQAADANLADGVYTLGTTDREVSPLEGKPNKTWYSYDNGDWKDPSVWTLDGAAFPRFENPGNQTPSPIDNVIITTGNRISIQPDNNNLEVSSIEVTGDLDMTSSTGHNFNIISGTGNIYLAGSAGTDNFPGGNITNFADPTIGGTVVLYGGGLALDKVRTFNNLRVNLFASTNEAVLLNNYILNGNLLVEKGNFKINDNTQTTNLTMDVYGDVTVDDAGSIRVGTADARHQMNLYGDFVNDGTAAFTNRTTPDYNNEATNGIIDVNFLNDTQNQSLVCDGPTRFYRIEINKGISTTYELHITASQATYFSLLGFANEGHPQVAQLTDNQNALGLIRGTVRIGTNVEIKYLNGSNNYNVSAAAQLWVDGGRVAKTVGTAIVLYGRARVSSGKLDALVGSGFTLRDNGTVQIEGTGELNAHQIRTSVLGASSLGGYVQTGGTVNLLGTGTNGDYYVFNLTYPGNVFTMTGGQLNIQRANGNGGIFINSDPENIQVTEGEVNLALGTNNDMVITSRAPFYNVNMRNTSGGTGKVVLAGGTAISSTDEDLAAQPLVVLNNLTIENNTHFKTNSQNVTVGRNFTIGDNALYEFENNTTIFNSNREATLFIGDITSVSNPSYTDPEANNPYTQWEHPFYHVVVNKPSATLKLKAKNPGNTGDDTAPKTPTNGKNVFRNNSNLIKVTGDFTLKAGTVDIDRYSLRLLGSNITNEGVLGLYTDGVSATDALIKFKSGVDYIITSADTAYFGNVRIGTGANTVTLTNNVQMKRLEYRHGRVYLGTHNLKTDILDINLEAGETQTNGPDRIFSTEDMFITAGNASDGGLSLGIPNPLPTAVRTYDEYEVDDNNTYNDVYNQPEELWFPLGTEANSNARYTPTVVTLSNVTDDGYITINPVDDQLRTTNVVGGELLSYYWQVAHSGFDNLPTVSYRFSYDNIDLDGGDDSQWVAGKVLSNNPFIRSGEDFEDSNGNQTLDAGEGNADLAAVDESNQTIAFDGPTGNGFTLEAANYTAGALNRFLGQVEVYYSRRISTQYDNMGNIPQWDENNTWSTVSHTGPAATDYPREGDIAIIGYGGNGGGGGGNRHHVAIRNDMAISVAQTIINSSPVNGVFDTRLFLEQGVSANLGIVDGNGTIEYWVASTSVPNITADFGLFVDQYKEGSQVSFRGTDDAPTILPSTPVEYPNVRIEGKGGNYRSFSFPVDITVRGDFRADNRSTLEVTHNITVEDDLTMGGFRGGRLVFANNAAHTIVVKDQLRTRGDGSTRIQVDNTTPNDLEHRIIVEGDIEHRVGSIDLFSNNTGGNNVILELAGNRSASFSKEANNDPELYRVVVNKGVNQDSTFTFEDEFNLRGLTDGAEKALELQNGTLVLNDNDININLTTGGPNFVVPATAALNINSGTVNTSGNDTGILLAGALRLTGNDAKVDMNNEGNGNNYIEYSVGNPTLEISAGELMVGSQIRRVLNDANGTLDYVQTGGTVTIGRKNSGVSSRGMLEVVNGGKFVHTGGTLDIVRSNNNASVAALYLAPNTFDTQGSTITLGDGNSPNGQIYGINSSIALHNLIINNLNGREPKAELRERPLTVNNTLTITSGATLDAGNAGGTGLALTLNGHLVNDGTYIPNGNTTTFSASTAQTISGSTSTEFYNLDKTNVGTLTLDQPILVARDLRMLEGTVADQGNTIEVRGNVTHDATHTSTGGEGVVFAGAAQQQLSRSLAGNSTFGTLTIRNSNGVIIPESNGFNFAITRQLRLDAGVLNIGSSALILEENAIIQAVNPFGLTNMVRTNSSFADAGLRKVFSAGATNNFVFPVGEDVYSPATVDFSATGANFGPNRGEIAVIPNRQYHPVINNGEENTSPNDPANVLQYYWAVRTEGLTDFTGSILFNYDQSDVALGTDIDTGDPYLESEYIPARILTLGNNTSVDKFSPTLLDENGNVITFTFSDKNDNEVYGDYFAGIDPAIPDAIPVFTSTGNGNYDDPTSWTIDPASTPFPAGGPQGSSIIIVKSNHTINFNRNDIRVYKTVIEAGAIIDLDTTKRHDLGIVTGQGTIDTETGVLPAGLYKDFFTCTGGKINYSGTGIYSVFKGNITKLREVIFSGASGQRILPNTANVEICENLIVDGPLVTNPNGSGTKNIEVGQDFLLQNGTYETGNHTLLVKEDMIVEGTYQGQNGHRSTINRDVTINSGGTFHAGSNSVIGIGGNLTYSVAGTFTSGTSLIAMQGNTVQTIAGTFTGGADMNRLEINNGAGVVLAGNIDIDTELILSNGTLTPGTSKLLLDVDATTGPDAIGNPNSFVNGKLCKIITNSEEFMFPVGKGNRWGYASVDPNPNDTHEWCVEYYNEIATNNSNISNLDPSANAILSGIQTISQNEYWRIEDNATGVPAIVGLRWDARSDVSTTSNDWYELKVMEWSPGIPASWNEHGGVGHESDPEPSQSQGFFRATSAISFSEKYVTLGSTTENNPLPVELISFTGEAQEQAVLLTWETASEINNDLFEVQRSIDGQVFEKIGELAGQGTSSEAHRYQFIDEQPLEGTVYYRLKQVDYNGMYDYSDLVAVDWIYLAATEAAPITEIRMFPNPSEGGAFTLLIHGMQYNSVVNIKLIDMVGKVHLQQQVEAESLAGSGLRLLPSTTLPAGLYFVNIQQGNTTFQKKLIVR